MNKRIILFDLDGTLIDSAPDVCRALNRVLTPYGRRPHSVQETKGYLGKGARILMLKALAATGRVPDGAEVDRMTRAFLDDYAQHPVIESKVFPGVEQSLHTLNAAGARLGICTNKPSITAAPVLDILALNQYFDVVVCGDQVEMQKPHGQHILDTITRMGGEPSSPAIMVGDSGNDIDAAIDAGIPSIAVTFGYAENPPETLGADALIDHFDQLIDTVSALFDKMEPG